MVILGVWVFLMSEEPLYRQVEAQMDPAEKHDGRWDALGISGSPFRPRGDPRGKLMVSLVKSH